jgi:hypothetical protein
MTSKKGPESKVRGQPQSAPIQTRSSHPRASLLRFIGQVLLATLVPVVLLWYPITKIPGVGTLTLQDVLLMVLWLIVAVEVSFFRAWRGRYRPLTVAGLGLALALLTALGSVVSVDGADGPLEFSLMMKRFGLAAIIPAAAALYMSPLVERLIYWTSGFSVLALLLASLFPVLRDAVPASALIDLESTGQRATGIITNPNDLAYTAMILGAVFVSLGYRKARSAWSASVFVMLAAGWCIVLSGSRSGLVAASGAVSYMLLRSSMRPSRKLAFLAVTVGIAVAGVSYSDVFSERLQTVVEQRVGEDSVASRLDAQEVAFRTSLSFPLGVGYLAFPQVTASFSSSRYFSSVSTSDSVYFDTLLASGFLGLLAFLKLSQQLWRLIQSSERPRVVVSTIGAAVIGTLIAGFATMTPVSYFIAPLFFLLGGIAFTGAQSVIQ